MISKVFYAFLFCCILNTILGQETNGQQNPQDNCMATCTNELFQGKKSWDTASFMAFMGFKMENVQVGNVTTQCIELNDTNKFDSSCQAVKDMNSCAGNCPDTQVKTVTMNSLKSLQFLCVDRVDDVKKYFPCMAEHCRESQNQCAPKCGSVTDMNNKINTIMKQSHGGGGQSEPTDPGQITKMMGEACSTTECFLKCCEPLTTKQCGKSAYLFERDLLWTMFSSIAQTLSSFGVQGSWPEECKELEATASSNDTAAAGKAATEVPGTETPQLGTTVAIIVQKTVAANNTTLLKLKEGATTPNPGGSANGMTSTYFVIALLPILAYIM